MNPDGILIKKVSYQDNAWSPICKELIIKEVLNDIKNGKYASQINSLRDLIKEENLEEYNIHKKSLPAVTFCGLFDGRRKRESIKNYNQLIVIDIDKLDEGEFIRVENVLETEKLVFSFWESPSKKGIKGLVNISYNFSLNEKELDNTHKSAFVKLQKYFLDSHNIKLDESGSDTTRLCFLSYDPHLKLKSEVVSFEIDKTDILKFPGIIKPKGSIVKTITRRNALYNPANKNKPIDRKTIQSIVRFLTKRNLSITYTYEEWYRVAYAIANTFTYEIGKNHFLSLSKLDEDKYNEVDCKNLLIYCYENSSGNINFSTIIYYANKKGYKRIGSNQAAKAEVSALYNGTHPKRP